MNSFNQSYTGIRHDLLKHVTGTSLALLDVGCATGANVRFLREQGRLHYSEGIELDQEMAAVAATCIDKVMVGDIEQATVHGQLPDATFDYILLGDVLEHLRDPWHTLAMLGEKLKPGGRIIFSVPNIRHIDVFIHVFVKGYWPYNERGIFDKTHVRMFTRRNVEELASAAGLVISSLHRNFRYRDAQGSQFPFYGALLRTLFADFYTFQFVVVCEQREQQQRERTG